MSVPSPVAGESIDVKASRTGVVTLSKYQESRLRHYNRTIDDYIRRGSSARVSAR
jgi:hypothetical protein